MTQTYLDDKLGSEVGYGQLLSVMLRRRFWFLGAFLLTLPLAAFVTLRTKPTYESSMKLLVESNYQEKPRAGQLGPENKFTDPDVELDYATQLHLMKGSQLMSRVVDRLSIEYLLSSPAPIVEIDPQESVDEAEITDQIVKKLQSSLSLSQVEEDDTNTKIFEAGLLGNDPLKTQRLLEAIQQVYLDYNLEQQKLRLTKGLAFIDEQLPIVRNNLIQAQAALEKFRKQHNLIEPGERATAIAESLDGVEQEQRELRAQYQDALATTKTLQKQLGRSPQEALIAYRLSQSSRYQTLLNALQETELELIEQQARYTNFEPHIQTLLEQRQNQRILLREEARRVLGEVPAQLQAVEANLFREGQLGAIDLDLAAQLVEARKNLQTLEARLNSLAKSERELRTELNNLPELIEEYNRLQPEVETRSQQLEQLLKARQELSIEIAQGGFSWQIVEPPQLGKKIGPSLKKNLLLGIVAGIFLGGIAAFLRESLDDTVRGFEQLKQQVSFPMLGVIPELSFPKIGNPLWRSPFFSSSDSVQAIAKQFDSQPLRESLDLIYKNLQLANSASELKSLTVTSAVAGEGKTTLVLGLALSAARLHRRVLIIDADFRRPSLHKLLNLSNEEGLTTFLESDETSLPTLQKLSLLGAEIDVLTAGPPSTDPVKLLSSNRIKGLMASFESTYDLVLLDTPPILGLADALQTASICSGVVMIARVNRVTQSEFTEATAMLDKFNVVGGVANGYGDSKNRYALYAEKQDNLSLRLRQPSVDR